MVLVLFGEGRVPFALSNYINCCELYTVYCCVTYRHRPSMEDSLSESVWLNAVGSSTTYTKAGVACVENYSL